MKDTFAVTKKNAFVPTLYLANLSFKLNEQGLSKFLSSYGKVTYLFMPKNKKTKKNTGVAFVQFSKKFEFEKALKALEGKAYMGRTLKASVAIENESMPFSKKEAIQEAKEIPVTKKKKVLKGLDLLKSLKA